MAGAASVPHRSADGHRLTVDEVDLRELVPQVLSVLVRRGADFATAEDAVQEALIRGLGAWDDDPPADPTGWLVTVAWRAFLDLARSETARRLMLSYGVRSVVTPDINSFSQMVERAARMARATGIAHIGDQLVVTAGVPFGTHGNTNTLRIAVVE